MTKSGFRLKRFAEKQPPYDDSPSDALVREIVEDIQVVEWWRNQHARPLSNVAAGLRYHVAEEDARVEGRVDVTQRLKRLPTIINKLSREPHMELARMYDIGGVRARLPDLASVEAVSRRLLESKNWPITHTRDYIANPKPSGYRALHHAVKRNGQLIEIQLRTVRQDVWANGVENDTRRLAVRYKFGDGEADVHLYYQLISEAFALMDRDEELSPQLRSDINEAHQRVKQRLKR